MSQKENRSDQDQVYSRPIKSIPPFSFNEEVAIAFDDMARRSIPFYDEVQRLTVALAQRYAQPYTNIDDLGCSTGTTILQLREAIRSSGPAGVTIRGIDSSHAMCRRAEAKLGLGDRELGGSTFGPMSGRRNTLGDGGKSERHSTAKRRKAEPWSI